MGDSDFWTINPANGQKTSRYSLMSDTEVRRRLEMAQSSFESWCLGPLDERTRLIGELGRVLEKKKVALANLITLEMGKVISEAGAEVEKSIKACNYFRDSGAEMLGEQSLSADTGRAYVAYRGMGVILGIMPWNFPVWQVIRFAVPALLSGNSVLLKHAPNVTGTALELEKIFVEAGFSAGLFQTLVLDIPQTERLIATRQVRGVSLTGSTRAGRRVAQIAGEHLKPCVLELGGNDPYLVLEDADLDYAAQTLVKSRMLNAGQSCIAAKRWIIVEDVYAEFARKTVDLVCNIIVGEPSLVASQMGPIARKDLHQQIKNQVQMTLAQGAKHLYSGVAPDAEGFYFAPQVLEIDSGMLAFEEELFGPVVSLIRAENEEAAIALANQSDYGLGAGVFSRDVKRAERIARDRLQAGSCFVNDFVKSDPRWPFGGIKDSGYGRELSELGARSFANIKTVRVVD